jgi:hypothetical protein
MDRAVFDDTELRGVLEDRFARELSESLLAMTLERVSRSDAGLVLTVLASGVAKHLLEDGVPTIPLVTDSEVGRSLIDKAQWPWRHLVLATKEFCVVDGKLDEEYLHQMLLKLYLGLFRLLEENSRKVVEEVRAFQE